jgi:hypothetical protein
MSRAADAFERDRDHAIALLRDLGYTVDPPIICTAPHRPDAWYEEQRQRGLAQRRGPAVSGGLGGPADGRVAGFGS